jgi:hypothetical protein
MLPAYAGAQPQYTGEILLDLFKGHIVGYGLEAGPTIADDRSTAQVATTSFVLTPSPPVGVTDSQRAPGAMAVSAHPNPFNPQTTIRYALPGRGRAHLSIYDVRGHLVAKLVDKHQSGGEYQVTWDGSDRHGMNVETGVYIVRLDYGGQRQTTKIILMK